MTQILTYTLSRQTPLCCCRAGTHSVCNASFPECLSFCFTVQMHIVSQSVAQVNGILICGALKVETEVNQSGVRLQSWRSRPALFILLVHTDLYSRSVLKQMTLGFPALDHNKKNTPTAYCGHLPLERHPLPLFSFSLHSYFSRGVLFNSSSWALIPQSLTPSTHLMYLSHVSRLPSFCSCTVTGAWMCFSAFSTTESSLCQRVRVGGWVGGHTQRGPSGKMGKAGGSWVGGVTRLPGCDLIRHNLLFPRQPLHSPSLATRPPPLSYSS